MSASCFFDNIVSGTPAVVFIDETSTGYVGFDNYSVGTVVMSEPTSFCNGMFMDLLQNCREFDDDDCVLRSIPTEVPSEIGTIGDKEDLAILKPTIFVTVPRLFNKMHDAI